MKIKKFVLLFTIIVSMAFFLTACSSDTAQISDKNGKSITVSTPDSDTYTFKLPVSQNEETPMEEAPVEEEPETVETESVTAETESEESSEGPKTGEP